MPTRRKNSSNWWINYVDPDTGKTTRRSAGPSYAEAEALERKLRAESYNTRRRRETDVRLDEVLAEYLIAHDTAPARSTAKHLLALADTWCSDLSTKLIRAHIAARRTQGAANGTINKELVMVSAAINEWNLNHDTALRNPVTGLKLQEPEGRLRWLTRNEYHRLVAASHGYLRDLIVIGTQTGMRKAELLGLTWDRVDLDGRIIRLEARHTKNRKPRAIPINQTCQDALACCATRRRNQWVFPSDQTEGPVTEIKRGFATACKRAGLDDVTPHILRHTTASWLVQAGVPLYEVSKLLGHSSLAVTQRYAHLAPDHLRSAIDVLG